MQEYTLSRTEELQSIFWDMYKDAHNFRPRHVDTSGWTEAEFEAEFQQLAEVIQREGEQRAQREAKAAHEFEMRVQDLLRSGAKTREMALRWIHEAEETGGDDQYLCYTLGLPYRYFFG
jgi:epoxyqueuosine reductase QueG